MTLEEMAAELRAKGWRCEEPWTKENCKHPQHMRMGSGGVSCDGSWHMSWTCRACGTSEKHSWPANPNSALVQLGWN